MGNYQGSVVKLIREHSCKKVAEVGVLRGNLARAVLAACQVEEYYLVDPWKSYGGFGAGILADITNWEDICQSIYSEFRDCAYIIRLESVRAATLFESNSLDLVFIDAVHEEEFVAEDIEAWLSKTRIIAGHDYSRRWPGVMKAVDSILPDRQLREGGVWFRST